MELTTGAAQEPPQITPDERPPAAFFRWVFVLLVPALTLFGLWQGFLFLRDANAPQLVITAVAIVWGVGGVAALFWVANWVIEQLPTRWVQRIQPFLFVGPAVLILLWYLALPAVRSLILSFRNPSGTAWDTPLFQNYVASFTERVMLEAYRNNLLWLVFGTFFTVSLGLLIAILADRSRFENVAKALIFLPMAISFVGAGVIWGFIYDPDPSIGLLNALVTPLGVEPQSWTKLLQPWNNLFLIVILVWMQTGFAMVLLSAAIKGVPDDLLEAARMDGANEVEIFLRIIIPFIQGTILTVTTTIIIFTLKIFDVVMATTGGQFGTEVIGVRFYRELFNNRDSGRGSAIAVILLLAVIPVMIYNLRQFRDEEGFR